MLGTIGCGLGPMTGSGSVGFSDVKTDVNWWDWMSAFIPASLYAMTSRLSGTTAQASVRVPLMKPHRRFGLWSSSMTMLFTYSLYYKKRLLLRCIHHFKSDIINNMDHMRISGTEPSSVSEFASHMYSIFQIFII